MVTQLSQAKLPLITSHSWVMTMMAAQTPAIAHFSVMKDINADYRSEWIEAPPLASYRNPYRVGWEQFLRHVTADAPLDSNFAAGIRDVAFAEACHRSTNERAWVAFPPPGKEHE